MAGIESSTRCSSSLVGPVRAVIRCGTMRSFLLWSQPILGSEGNRARLQGSSAADFAVSEDYPLEGRQALQAHRAARMELVGADADFRAQPVLEAIGEAGAGIHHHAGRIHLAQEA